MTKANSFASGLNLNFIEGQYEAYCENPSNVDISWQQFFIGYDFAIKQGFVEDGEPTGDRAQGHAKVEALINAYRRLGHLWAHLNPLADESEHLELRMKPSSLGLDLNDRDSKFLPANFGKEKMTLPDIMEKLVKTYCGTIGADFREINDIDAVEWLQAQMEGSLNKPNVSKDLKKAILGKLSEAEGFERFLQSRYLGQKRFSLEGLESLIPLLNTIIDEAGKGACEEVCLGMAHRGRLNVLANIMGKPYEHMLSEFEGSDANPFDIDGDVKYHLGYGSEIKTNSGKTMRLYLSPNPSHLEAVNPVLEGFTRCRQDQAGTDGHNKSIPILLHGDASFVGQGLVTETFNLAHLDAYTTGGTIHIITNNQIGFTTNPSDSRSCRYSSDISKIVRAPVFHVNADDPEAVIWVGQLALMFRSKFNKDVVIDLIGYRKHGHNETDEPAFTQPKLYKKISKHPSVLTQYKQQLEKEGFSRHDLDAEQSRVKERLQAAYEKVHGKRNKSHPDQVPDELKEVFAYTKVSYKDVYQEADTKVKIKDLLAVGQKITDPPPNFTLHPKLKRILGNRAKMLEGEGKVDWAFAELLAFGSLAQEGFDIRLSGQDCKRGTFSSRHGVYFDFETGKAREPLNDVGQGKVSIINSPLSEQGCLGFEFGYSVANKNALVLWEAQFGDFANGGQIIIDQFIAASEAKWQQTSGLVLLLPHGYEGMGPEHSSARPERFLQCCGNLNMQVCNVTTPSQYFHLLRRQLYRPFRKPLIIMTPKSLLRHPKVVSQIKFFTDEGFSEVLFDWVEEYSLAKRVIFCTGKIYYELLEKRNPEAQLQHTLLVRLEQLYPFPKAKLSALFEMFSHVEHITWVQEEPKNMGAWSYVRPRLEEVIPKGLSLKYVGRKNSGSTAEGSGKSHQLEQSRIIEEAFDLVCAWEPEIKAHI